jgi:predicted transport protein
VLFKLKQMEGGKTTFVPVMPTSMTQQGLQEKAMEQWLADNSEAVLPEGEHILVISQEHPFEPIVDILAVDSRGNLVVIEIKRGQTPRDVIAQALDYASGVASWDYQQLNQRAMSYFHTRGLPYESLLAGLKEALPMVQEDFSEADFNRAQRIFIVGEGIDEKIERTARWLLNRGVEISCISYQCYAADAGELFLDFEQVVRVEEISQVKKVGGSQPPVVSEDAFVEQLPSGLRLLYEGLKERVTATTFGGDVTTGAAADYLKFTAGRNFAEIHPKRKTGRLQILVRRPEGFSNVENETVNVAGILVTRVPDSRRWPLNHWFNVDQDTNTDAVEQLLRQSYDAVHGKAK